MSGPRLKLTGYKSAEQIDRIISSALVDVVYVDEITPKAMFLIPDDFDVREQFAWIEDILKTTFAARGIEGVEISLET